MEKKLKSNNKIRLILIIIMLSGTIVIGKNSYCQNSDILESKEITWYGIDFTHVKLIGGNVSFSDPQKIRDYYFNILNQLVLNESKKFKLDDWFKKDVVKINLDYVRSENLKVLVDGLFADIPQSLSVDTLNSIVLKIGTAGAKTKLGAILVMENMIKTNNNYGLRQVYYSKKGAATMWVILFDTEKNEIVAKTKVEGKVKGIGFRNNWANAIYKGMKHFKYKNLMSE